MKTKEAQTEAKPSQEQVKKSIDYNAVIDYNQKYIDILNEEKQWYQLDIQKIDAKVVAKSIGKDLTHELSLKRILAHKRIHQLNSEIETKLNFIEQMKGFLANESTDK